MGNQKKSNKKKKGGGGSGKKSKKNVNNAVLSSSSTTTTESSSSNVSSQLDLKEERILSELRTRTRSLLASMKGVAPDGAPFICVSKKEKQSVDDNNTETFRDEKDGPTKDHPLALLHASIVDLLEQLMHVQRERKCVVELNNHEQNTTTSLTNAQNEKCNTNEQKCHDTISLNNGGSSSRDDPQVWEEFNKWLSDCGIEPKEKGYPVEIQKVVSNGGSNDSDAKAIGYGLFATRDIMHDEIILEIPVPVMMCPYWRHCLDTTTASSDNSNNKHCSSWCEPPPPFDSSRSQQEDELYRPLSLVMFLLNERWRGSRSLFGPYLDTLPRTYSTPLYWSLTALREFGHSTLHLKRAVTQQALNIWEYLQMRDAIINSHASQQRQGSKKTQNSDLIPTSEFTYELFRWATATAHTRQNLIPFFPHSSDTNQNDKMAVAAPDVQNAYGLIPLWDLLNHEDSDRACRSEVTIVDDGKALIETEDEKERHDVLICRTPPAHSDMTCDSLQAAERENTTDLEGDGKNKCDGNICFRRGEEVTMYYGERSNAQLLFHSGFVNGGLLGKESKTAKEHDTDLLSVENSHVCSDDEDAHWWTKVSRTVAGSNQNRMDCIVLRLALPPADCDGGLDRVREMVAARFGFCAYVDQGCHHSGLSSALAAAKAAQQDMDSCSTEEETKKELRSGKNETQEKAVGSKRDNGSAVMTEVSVSLQDPCPGDLLRALLVCMANKEELAELLRNCNKYMDDSVIKKNWYANGDVDDSILHLGYKHVRFIAALIEESNNNHGNILIPTKSKNERDVYAGMGKFWINDQEVRRLSSDLRCTDQITLNAWFSSFCERVIPK
mmetsp:Transcript_9812/g.14626  ORF Transcript_9812/g.14626 Transcript_9812/m.14626 type:complete len:837 (+) Transcript_9812:522-3032(+)